jgi:hypothetical protein
MNRVVQASGQPDRLSDACRPVPGGQGATGTST